MYPYIANYIRKTASTASVLSKAAGHGIAWVNGVLYINTGSGATAFADAIASSSVANVGAKNGATVSATEVGFGGILHKTTLTLTATPLTLVNADGLNGLGVKVYDFPAGGITILGASGSVAETTTSILADTLNASVTYNWGVGTTTQVNAVLATTEQNIIQATNGTASATINVAGAASPASRTAAPASFDGHTTALDAFFNVGVATDTDIDAAATTTWTGTIYIVWLFSPDV